MGVMKNVHKCVESDVEVCRVESHGLFSHGTLQCVTRSLIVVGERNH